MQDHLLFMQRCLELAKNGEGTTAPNPMVGCVVVHKGELIGEGWHKKAGLPHAEVNAINSVEDQSLLAKSTIYVSLEPCAHQGKTPPCALLIIKKKIPKVVIGCLDPNPAVAGKGVQMLQDAGIEVTVGVLKKEAEYLNRKFMVQHSKQRPYITLKWAQSADGFIDKKRLVGERGMLAISGPEAKVFVHKLRSTHDAILVGTNTAINDNPSLTTREYHGKNPLRLVLDRSNRLPKELKLFTDEGATWHFYSSGNPRVDANKSIRVDRDYFIEGVVAYCHDQGLQSILAEGGAETLQGFIKANLWDEAWVLQSELNLKEGLQAPKIQRESIGVARMGKDVLIQYSNDGLSNH